MIAKLRALYTQITKYRGRHEQAETLTAAGFGFGTSDAADEIERLRKALEQVERWEGFPATGEFYIDGSPMSYGTWNGSNGERDFMRKIARTALETQS